MEPRAESLLPEQFGPLQGALLAYCQRDTEAMVRVFVLRGQLYGAGPDT